ncbi:translation elongation factor Ts [Botrimarina hoheduenensis]|uniref:Elongation factor Ts n=1 Tax=Botrimarina hoheduenensis TaxID=2528000 RepID=A0A5C5WCE9_9BACT|nr:translation elongation factor Ts [Botrimarina hoheduenensis]TWT47342.1 Elongation factor Ts [Botrimarina hoheduenensis]
MAEITAAMVKELRDETQLPMMDCKKALAEAGGDKEAAKQALREKGLKLMEGRRDRVTEEGRIAVFCGVDQSAGAIIELQVESAPVAGNPEVVALANDLAKQLATGPGAATADALWEQPSPTAAGKKLKEIKDDLENRIREVFKLARIARVEGPCGGYVHFDGKSGVLLSVEGGTNDLAKDISMHVAAMKPTATSTDELDADEVARERAILVEAAKNEGKPDNIIEKMVDGRMKNYYAEKVLSEQAFVKDDKQTVGAIAKAGGMKLKGFTSWRLGETSVAS